MNDLVLQGLALFLVIAIVATIAVPLRFFAPMLNDSSVKEFTKLLVVVVQVTLLLFILWFLLN